MQGPLCTLSSHLLSSPRPGGGCPPRSPTPEGGTSSEGLLLSRLSSVPAGPWALWGDGRGLGTSRRERWRGGGCVARLTTRRPRRPMRLHETRLPGHRQVPAEGASAAGQVRTAATNGVSDFPSRRSPRKAQEHGEFPEGTQKSHPPNSSDYKSKTRPTM